MEPVRVVGVAVIARGPGGSRVLAARRRGPLETGGGWELPGGKCETGESLASAAVREIREELDCEVRVTGRLAGAQEIRPGVTLEVVVAELEPTHGPAARGSGEPRPLEHEALRWLAADELDQVEWLPADVFFLQELAGRLEEGL